MNRILDIAKRALIIAIVALAVVYAGDYLWLHYRMLKPKANDPFDVITIQRVYEVPQKDGRFEITLADPQKLSCVHALFPHAGYTTCWYVNRLNNQPIPMSIFVAPPSAAKHAPKQ